MVVLDILVVIIAIILIVSVLLQDSNADGMGALTGGSSESFFGKNKGNSLQGRLAMITKIAAVAFVVVSLLILILVS